MKITKISVCLSDTYGGHKLVTPALMATFSPFGSLTEGVDGNALAEAMTRWVDANNTEEKKEVGSELIRLVWSATTDQLSTIEIGSWEISLRTPTSDTRIRLYRSVGHYHIEVDFGTKGSESRAVAILMAAELANVKFSAYWRDSHIGRETVLRTLHDQAQAYLDLYETGYYKDPAGKDRAIANEEFFAMRE